MKCRGVSMGVLTALVLVGCGRHPLLPRGTIVTVTSLAQPMSTTYAPQPDDGRLHRPYATDEYSVGSPSMGSWRADPAPDVLTPRLTQAQVIRLVRAGPVGGQSETSGATFTARFGLWTGNLPNPETSDHHL